VATGLLVPPAPEAQPLSKKVDHNPGAGAGITYHIVLADTTAVLARYLSQETHLTVIDRTVGLPGIRVFRWDYYPFPRDVEGHFAPPKGDFLSTLASWHDEGLRKIGLRLKPVKEMLPNTIVDKIDRTPTEN